MDPFSKPLALAPDSLSARRAQSPRSPRYNSVQRCTTLIPTLNGVSRGDVSAYLLLLCIAPRCLGFLTGPSKYSSVPSMPRSYICLFDRAPLVQTVQFRGRFRVLR
eukprot:4771949-Pyramimonas_sp.AAC.2